MKIVQSLLVGASYFCILRTKASEILVNTQRTCNMADCSNSEEKYEPGSTSLAFVTTPNDASAKKIATELINQKLAACVNIVPQITSVYMWDGKINEDTEVLLMIKTRTSTVNEMTKFVKDNHPYSVAEVITLPIENGNLPYLNWISKTVPAK